MYRYTLLVVVAAAVVLSSGCMATRNIPSARSEALNLEAARAAFAELHLDPQVNSSQHQVVSKWSWCGDRDAATLVCLFPLCWARYKATASADSVKLEGEAWGANALLIFGILPGALVNIPLPFPMDKVEDKITAQLKK